MPLCMLVIVVPRVCSENVAAALEAVLPKLVFLQFSLLTMLLFRSTD